MSGGIVFTMLVYQALVLRGLQLISINRYEKTMDALDNLDPQKKYI